ncbi:MAG TPA: signal peptidase I [Bacillota bacterium]|nr:signal peptidase I [Bacillota bacterium]
MEEEYNVEETEELVLENKKLLRKSLIAIIGFFSMFIISLILFIVLQGNKFFIFNLHRTFESSPSPLIAEVFSVFFVFIIIVALITYSLFARSFYLRKKLTEDEQLESLTGFRRKYNTADVFSVVPIFLIIVMIINGFFFSFAQVNGTSMQPTFCSDDAVIIKYVESYEDNDIVILEQSDMYMIKRLVAKPGDTLLVNWSGVYVNGELLESLVGSSTVQYNLVIPDGYYYVLGDNREVADDSRHFGLVSEENMLGKVVLRISNTSCEIGG